MRLGKRGSIPYLDSTLQLSCSLAPLQVQKPRTVSMSGWTSRGVLWTGLCSYVEVSEPKWKGLPRPAAGSREWHALNRDVPSNPLREAELLCEFNTGHVSHLWTSQTKEYVAQRWAAPAYPAGVTLMSLSTWLYIRASPLTNSFLQYSHNPLYSVVLSSAPLAYLCQGSDEENFCWDYFTKAKWGRVVGPHLSDNNSPGATLFWSQ